MDQAEASYAESLRLCRELGDRRSIAYSLEHYAGLAACRQDWERSARLFGAADTLRQEIQAPLPPDAAVARADTLALVRAALGNEVYEAAYAAGREMDLEAGCALTSAFAR